MRRIVPKHLIAVWAVVFVAIITAELTLPCSAWRWPVAAAFIVLPLLTIIAVGDGRTRPDISDTARNVAITLSAMGLLSGAGVAVGFFC